MLVAFLRGINVGGHKVIRMSELAAMFSGLGFGGVRTFIASGNVLFEPPSTKDRRILESHIGRAILETFGHEVAVMVRTCGEIADMARSVSISPPPSPLPTHMHRREGEPDKVYAIFLSGKPSAQGIANLKSLQDEIDRFEFRETEVIWHCRRSVGESRLTNVLIERKLGVAGTARDWNTVMKLAALCQGD